jgi:hypothetical protein
MKVELIIQLDEKGQVSVSGPVENKILCYGLLEASKEAIRSFVAPKIQPAGADDLARFKAHA